MAVTLSGSLSTKQNKQAVVKRFAIMNKHDGSIGRCIMTLAGTWPELHARVNCSRGLSRLSVLPRKISRSMISTYCSAFFFFLGRLKASTGPVFNAATRLTVVNISPRVPTDIPFCLLFWLQQVNLLPPSLVGQA